MAGAGVKEIKRRIRAVKSTQQITKAMELVAAAKVRRAQDRVLAARPYARRLRAVLSRLATAAAAPQAPAEPVARGAEAQREPGNSGSRAPGADGRAPHPLMAAREVKRVGLVAVTGDRGLAGSYNANIIRRVTQRWRELEADGGPGLSLVAVGRKARDHFGKRGYPILESYVGLGEEASLAAARRVARRLMDLYLDGSLDEVRVVYTEFVSALVQYPREIRLLPVSPEAEPAPGPADEAAGVQPESEVIYEPGPEAVLARLVPRYVELLVFQVLLEAKASEHGARMTAMRSASDNAGELIEELTLDFNRARQASITKELMDIVGGAEALKQ